MAKQAISASLDTETAHHLELMSQRADKSRSEVLDTIIQEHYKSWLRKELMEAARAQDDDDVAMAEKHMKDYSDIITRDEK